MSSPDPEDLAWHADGTPYSPRYGDIYHTRSGPAQATRVFVEGNDLPRRFAQGEPLVVVETGFGLGLNFFATWRAWRDAGALAPLRYVACERHPLSRAALADAHARLGSEPGLADALAAGWPEPVAHGAQVVLEHGGTPRLELRFGAADTALAGLELRADALFLDGFSPATNPDMWTPEVFEALARVSHGGTTLSTYTVAQDVRLGLTAAGFEVEKRPGYGDKLHRLGGRFTGRTSRPASS